MDFRTGITYVPKKANGEFLQSLTPDGKAVLEKLGRSTIGLTPANIADANSIGAADKRRAVKGSPRVNTLNSSELANVDPPSLADRIKEKRNVK